MPKGDILMSIVNTRNQSADEGIEQQKVMSSYLFSNVTASV